MEPTVSHMDDDGPRTTHKLKFIFPVVILSAPDFLLFYEGSIIENSRELDIVRKHPPSTRCMNKGIASMLM